MLKITWGKSLAALLLMFGVGNASAQLVEDFETTPLTGWSFYQTESDDPGFVVTTSQSHSGSQSFFHDDDNTVQLSTSWMVSPAYTCGSTDELIFWYRQTYTASYYNYSGVYISTGSNDPLTNPTDFIELEELNDASQAGYSDGVWSEFQANLNAYAGQTIHVAFKYTGDFEHELYIDDVTLDAAPTCPNPEMLTTTAVTDQSIAVTWTVIGSEPAWELEYGPTGFTPGTGQTQIETSNSGTINGLSPNTTYDVYVRGLCGPGDTSIYSGVLTQITNCVAIQGYGYCESFDSDSQNESCWTVLDVNNDGDAWDLNYTYNPNSGDQVATLYTDYNAGDNNDYLISPNLILTGNEVISFSYRVASANEPNDLQLLLSTTGINPADFTDTLMALDQFNNTSYQDTSIDLSSFTGPVFFAFNVPPGGLDGWRLYIDDVCIDVCVPVPSISGQEDVCMTDTVLNLMDVITTQYKHGTWYLPSNPSDLYDDSLVNIAGIPQGTHQAYYILETGCGYVDSSVAEFTVYQLSSAGQDGSVDVCKNQPINLFEGLSGNIDLGGVWMDYQDNVLSSSQPIAPNIPGSFNYRYYADNGVCPEDTALLVINILDCDYLSVEEEILNTVNIYPNPANDIVTLTVTETLVADVEIVDVKGSVVYAQKNAFENNTQIQLSIDDLDKGVYFVRLKGVEAQQTLRLLKQ